MLGLSDQQQKALDELRAKNKAKEDAENLKKMTDVNVAGSEFRTEDPQKENVRNVAKMAGAQFTKPEVSDAVSTTTKQEAPKTTVSPATIATPTAIAAPNAIAKVAAQFSPEVAKISGNVPSIYSQPVTAANQEVASATSMAKAAAEGKAPSFAEQLLRNQSEAALKQQMAAASSQPFNPAIFKQLQSKGLEQQQIVGQQAAAIRAQEQADALKTYTGTALGAQSGATEQSKVEAQTKLNALSEDARNQVQTNAQKLQALGIDTDAALKIELADQSNKQLIAQLGNQVNIANVENGLKAQLANQGQDLEVWKQKIASGDNIALANMQKELALAGLTQDQQKAMIVAMTGALDRNNAIERAKLGKPSGPSIADRLWAAAPAAIGAAATVAAA